MNAEDRTMHASGGQPTDLGTAYFVCTLLLLALTFFIAYYTVGRATYVDPTGGLVWVAAMGFSAVVCAILSLRQAIMDQRPH